MLCRPSASHHTVFTKLDARMLESFVIKSKPRSTRATVSETNSFAGILLVIGVEFLFEVRGFILAELP